MSAHLPLAHLNLTVRDVDRSVGFDRRWFGFTSEPKTYSDGTVFARNADRFDLALCPGDPPYPPYPPAAAVHLGFRAAAPDDVRGLREALAGAGVPIIEAYDTDGFVNLKCLDPDGDEIEVYWEQGR